MWPSSASRGKLYVIKRNGRKEDIFFDKITSRIEKLCYQLNFVDPAEIAKKVIGCLFPGVKTVELDNMAAEIAAVMAPRHPEFAILAARIAISNLQKETKKTFSDVITDLYNHVSQHSKKQLPLISETHYTIIMKNADRLNSVIIYDRDFHFSYFGCKALEESFLMKINGKVVERPQHMMMRVAIGIHGEDIDSAIETYNLMSEKYFIHSARTMKNAATFCQQLSNSFIVAMEDDSIEGIFNTLATCARISKYAGSLGLNLQNIRASNSYIAGTNGVSNGLVPMLRVYNNVARYIDQGGNKNPGQFLIYLEPWHADVFEYLSLKKNAGKEEVRARDLSYALWITDEFMKRVENDENWYLMCPNQCPGLPEAYGDAFATLYKKYVEMGRYVRKVAARELWFAILDAQLECGQPCLAYKDSCNLKSNLHNVGTVKGSNFTGECTGYSSSDESVACNSASIAVNMFLKPDKSYDFEKLKEVTKVVTRNLDKLIDVSFYPVPEAKISTCKHRPIGIGVEGLADLFMLLKYPFIHEKSELLNKQIFETIYYGALEASCELAAKYGPYETYKESPISKGILQYEMWGASPTPLWDWNALKEKIREFGVRNSLLVAQPASSDIISVLGNNATAGPYLLNVFTRKVSSGEIKVINHHLLRDLVENGLWNENMQNEVFANDGSIQNIARIPKEFKEIYRTAWEMKQKSLLRMAADRAPFIDQSESLNIHFIEPDHEKLTSVHFCGWKLGLKAGMHNLKTSIAKPVTRKIETKGIIVKEENTLDETFENACSLLNKEDCVSCSA